jgi:hypothetical protein
MQLTKQRHHVVAHWNTGGGSFYNTFSILKMVLNLRCSYYCKIPIKKMNLTKCDVRLLAMATVVLTNYKKEGQLLGHCSARALYNT